MFMRHAVRQWFFLAVFLILLLIVSSCGSSSPVLFEQTKLSIHGRPTPGPLGVVTNRQPCSAIACTPTPVAGNPVPVNTGNPGTGNNPNAPAITSVLGSHLIDASNNIHTFLTFSYNVNDPASIAKAYDFVWGAETYQVQGFRASNPNIMLSYYIPYNRDVGAYGQADLAKQHDLNYWRSNHPDWVLYKCDGSTPAYLDDNTIPLDISNPDVVNYQMQNGAIPASQNGYDALATDNVNLENTTGACGFYHGGQWIQRYSGNTDDPQWRSDILGWMTRLQEALHALPHPMALVPNLSLAPLSPGDPFAQQIADHVDAILDEGGFTQYGQGYLTDNAWLQTVQYIKSVQQRQKPYYILNEVPDTGNDQMQWNIASYLMAKERYSAIFIAHNQDYGSDKRYNEYNTQIGAPTGEMYSGQSVYWRNYSGGVVVVNPSGSNSYTVSAPAGNFSDMYGNHVGQSFTMPPHSGMVLLNA